MRDNPYSPPSAAGERVPVLRVHRSTRGLRWACAAQLVMLLIGFALERVDVETIVVTGALYTICGIAVLVLASRARQVLAVISGLSAILFPLFVTGLILVKRWGPGQADEPVSLLVLWYTVICGPVLALFILQDIVMAPVRTFALETGSERQAGAEPAWKLLP